jgi:hypothetical protein
MPAAWRDAAPLPAGRGLTTAEDGRLPRQAESGIPGDAARNAAWRKDVEPDGRSGRGWTPLLRPPAAGRRRPSRILAFGRHAKGMPPCAPCLKAGLARPAARLTPPAPRFQRGGARCGAVMSRCDMTGLRAPRRLRRRGLRPAAFGAGLGRLRALRLPWTGPPRKRGAGAASRFPPSLRSVGAAGRGQAPRQGRRRWGAGRRRALAALAWSPPLRATGGSPRPRASPLGRGAPSGAAARRSPSAHFALPHARHCCGSLRSPAVTARLPFVRCADCAPA